jgi:sec-independent protein translocase protein TatC
MKNDCTMSNQNIKFQEASQDSQDREYIEKIHLKKLEEILLQSMSLEDHISELLDRFFFCILFLMGTILSCFSEISGIVRAFEKPAVGIKFLQFSPGEYFFSSIKMALFSGVVLTLPMILFQICLYLSPALLERERRVIFPLLIASGTLFLLGSYFSYIVIVPGTIKFFIAYGSEIIEPLLSFNQYIEFVSFSVFISGILFQIPVIQIILGLSGIVSGQKMLDGSKYTLLCTIVVSAMITPSSDPVTQILMSAVLFLLYLSGAFCLIILVK